MRCVVPIGQTTTLQGVRLSEQSMISALAIILVVSALSPGQAAAPPIDEGYFVPTNRITGLLNPNPANSTCQVVMGVSQSSTTGPVYRQPSASQVPSVEMGNLTLQVSNLEDYAFEDGFELVLDMPLDALIASATNATISAPQEGKNATAAYPLLSGLPLAADAEDSQFINCTIMAATQDFTPRDIYLNGTRCALALEGFKPADLPPLTLALAPILSVVPPLAANPAVPPSGQP